MPLQPLTDKTRFPDDDALRASLGEPYYTYWTALDSWLRGVYAVEPLVQYGGAKSGWTFRYRKGGRPLCEMTPAAGGFSTLVVLGAKEGAQALENAAVLGPSVRECLETAHVYHDGRWLFITVRDMRDVEDIQRLVTFKRPIPKPRKAAAVRS